MYPHIAIRAVIASLEAAGRTHHEAVIEALPDWLEWDASGYHGATRGARCGGGDPPESAGFDSFELDRTQTPAWAVEIFDGLSSEDQDGLTTAAEEAEIERREP